MVIRIRIRTRIRIEKPVTRRFISRLLVIAARDRRRQCGSAGSCNSSKRRVPQCAAIMILLLPYLPGVFDAMHKAVLWQRCFGSAQTHQGSSSKVEKPAQAQASSPEDDAGCIGWLRSCARRWARWERACSKRRSRSAQICGAKPFRKSIGAM